LFDYQTSLYTSADGGISWQGVGAAPFRTFSPIVCNWHDRCLAVGAGTTGGTAIVELALSVRDVPDPPPTTTVPTVPNPPGPPVPPSLVGIKPARLLETRSGPEMTTVDGLYEGGGLVHAGTEVVLPVSSRGGVDAHPGSVALNVTVTEPAAPGYITVYPCDRTRPVASNVNFTTGQTVANSVIAKVATNGTICLFSSADTHMVVDVNGFVSSLDPSLVAVVPARLIDSRSGPGLQTTDHLFEGSGRIAAGSTVTLPVRGRGGVPAGAVSAVLNITVTDPASAGFVTVFPCDRPRPLASNVNFTARATVANAAFATLSGTGQVCVYSSADTHLVVDINGYVASRPDVRGVVPARLLETRSGPQMRTIDHVAEGIGIVAAGTVTTLRVAGRGGVAIHAESALLNVTVTEPKSPGFLTVYPCDQPRPMSSNANFTAGATVANLVVAKLSGSGDVCLFSSAATHLVVDVGGFTVSLPPHF
jgi:hypothetical protein